MNNITYDFKNQKGVALVAALVILLVLTMIGVTAMNTSTLEEKMAVNMQENYTAFHVSETGVNQVLINVDSITFGGDTVLPQIVVDAGRGVTADVTTAYRDSTKPPKRTEALYSASQFQAAHFDVVSTGKASSAASSAESRIRAGVYQILPGGISN